MRLNNKTSEKTKGNKSNMHAARPSLLSFKYQGSRQTYDHLGSVILNGGNGWESL